MGRGGDMDRDWGWVGTRTRTKKGDRGWIELDGEG